jgi:hypothetical protein
VPASKAGPAAAEVQRAVQQLGHQGLATAAAASRRCCLCATSTP